MIRATRTGFFLRGPGSIVRRYNWIGKLISIKDENGHGLELTYRVRTEEEVRLEGRNVSLNCHLYDAKQKTYIIGKSYSGRAADIRQMVHKFADEMVFRFTGEHGIASSKIALVLRTGQAKEIYIADYDGKGDVVGGIVIMRQGENALAVIERIKAKLEELRPSLPPGTRIVTTYDRSDLIERAIENVSGKLVEEIIIVSLIILLFLWHIPSAVIPIVTIPVSVAFSFIAMYAMGIGANLMSLAGIAISIGVLVAEALIGRHPFHAATTAATETQAETQTALLNDGLLTLERDPQNAESLEALMRAAHSLKGAARIVQSREVHVEISDSGTFPPDERLEALVAREVTRQLDRSEIRPITHVLRDLHCHCARLRRVIAQPQHDERVAEAGEAEADSALRHRLVALLLERPGRHLEHVVEHAHRDLDHLAGGLQLLEQPRHLAGADALQGEAAATALNRARHFLEVAEKLGVPEADRPKLTYRLGKAWYRTGGEPGRVIDYLARTVDGAADNLAEGSAHA